MGCTPACAANGPRNILIRKGVSWRPERTTRRYTIRTEASAAATHLARKGQAVPPGLEVRQQVTKADPRIVQPLGRMHGSGIKVLPQTDTDRRDECWLRTYRTQSARGRPSYGTRHMASRPARQPRQRPAPHLELNTNRSKQAAKLGEDPVPPMQPGFRSPRGPL